MKFTNHAGEPISFAQASAAFVIQLALGGVVLAGFHKLVVLFFSL